MFSVHLTTKMKLEPIGRYVNIGLAKNKFFLGTMNVIGLIQDSESR